MVGRQPTADLRCSGRRGQAMANVTLGHIPPRARRDNATHQVANHTKGPVGSGLAVFPTHAERIRSGLTFMAHPAVFCTLSSFLLRSRCFMLAASLSSARSPAISCAGLHGCCKPLAGNPNHSSGDTLKYLPRRNAVSTAARGGKPWVAKSTAASGAGVSGSAKESGALRVPSLTTMISMAPSLRRIGVTAADGGRPERSAQARWRQDPSKSAAMRMPGPHRRVVLFGRVLCFSHHEKMSAMMPAYQPIFSCWVCLRSSAGSRRSWRRRSRPPRSCRPWPRSGRRPSRCRRSRSGSSRCWCSGPGRSAPWPARRGSSWPRPWPGCWRRTPDFGMSPGMQASPTT